ncbi:hypothetical protein BH09SUM1_BH09SUM1_30550 [soil metagenome]
MSCPGLTPGSKGKDENEMGLQRVNFRYSDAFQRKVVEELESGRLSSLAEAGRRYGIKGSMTVKGWVRRLGKNHLLGRTVRVETPDEKKEINRLRKQVKELESALAKTRCRELLNEAFLEIWCEKHGEDLAEFKKKADATLSKRQGTGGPVK